VEIPINVGRVSFAPLLQQGARPNRAPLTYIPPSPYNLTRRRKTITLHCVLFSSLLPVIRRRWKKWPPTFCCPLPPIIIYNYILLLLLHTHIHPVAPLMDYQLTNTTEEKNYWLLTSTIPVMIHNYWLLEAIRGRQHYLQRGKASILPSSSFCKTIPPIAGIGYFYGYTALIYLYISI